MDEFLPVLITENAGCNNDSASYGVNGGRITVGKPIASSRLCETPEGVMEQEAELPGRAAIGRDLPGRG